MKVCLLSGEYPPMQGGVGDYTARLAAALAALGHEVHAVTGRHSAAADEGTVTVHRPVSGWDWRMPGPVLASLKQIAPSVVHIQYQAAAYGLHPEINLLPWLVRRAGGWRVNGVRPRLVVTLHDLLYPYLFPKAGPLRFGAVMAMVRSCDAVVVTNRADEEALCKQRRLPSVHRIPIGSNIAARPPAGFDRAAFRASLGIGPDEVALCYFGFLSPAKGGETLIRALGLLEESGERKYHLVMIGGAVGDSDATNQAYLGQVWTLIRTLGLEDRVHWTGFISPEQVSAHLLASDMAALPYREGANLRHGSLHAALAHGVPVVTTRPAEGISELVDGEEAALAPPDDPEALAGAIAALAADPVRRSCLSAGALALARQFTWEGIAEAHVGAYRRLAAGDA